MSIGLIGTGWGVRVQVPVFHSVGLKVVALAGRDGAKTSKIAADFGISKATADWREVLADDEVKIVSIVTPVNLHAEMAIAALEAGKHVLCEKPTALNIGEAQRMLDAAKAHPNQFALIDHELRFTPAFAKMRSLLREGAIGTLKSATLQMMNGRWGDPSVPWNWLRDVNQGGGLFGAIGSHHIDTFRFLMSTEVTSISTFLHTFIKERPGTNGMQTVTSDDYYQARLIFTNGVVGTAESNFTVKTDEGNSLTIYGSDGALRLKDSHTLSHAPAGKPFTDITSPHLYEALPNLSGEFPHATVYLAHALKAYLAGDTSVLAHAATFEDGLQIQKALDAGRRSHVAGGILEKV